MIEQPTEKWIPRDTLATRILLVRTSLGLSQREASAQTGIPYGSWQSMEDGRSPRDLAAKVAAISLALGVDRDWLMWGGPLANDSGPTPGEREAGGGAGIRRFVAPAEGLEPSTCRLTITPPIEFGRRYYPRVA
jgi:transcriptional regulator with XRE-family HTH domain